MHSFLHRTFTALRLQARQRDYLMPLCNTVTQVEAAVLAARKQSYSLHGLRKTKAGEKVVRNSVSRLLWQSIIAGKQS